MKIRSVTKTRQDHLILKRFWFILATLLFTFSVSQFFTVYSWGAPPALPGINHCQTWATEILLDKESLPDIFISNIRTYSDHLNRLLAKANGKATIKDFGTFKFKLYLNHLVIDFTSAQLRKLPTEQIIREDAALEEVFDQKGILKRTGIALSNAKNRARNALCSLGTCLKNGLYSLGDLIGEISESGFDSEDSEMPSWTQEQSSDPVQLLEASDLQAPSNSSPSPWPARVPQKLRDQPDQADTIKTLESLYKRRDQYRQHFKTLPQVLRTEYEIIAPVLSVSATLEMGLKNDFENYSRRISIKLKKFENYKELLPKIALRFSLGENGKLIHFKLQGSDGRFLSKFIGARISFEGDLTSFLSSLSAGLLDQVSQKLYQYPSLRKKLANQFQYETIRLVGDLAETSLENLFRKSIQTTSVDLGTDSEFKAQYYLSLSASFGRLAEIQHLETEFYTQVYALKQKVDGTAPKGISAVLDRIRRRSRIHQIDDLALQIIDKIQAQVRFSKDFPSLATIHILSDLERLTRDLESELLATSVLPMKDEKKEHLQRAAKTLSRTAEDLLDLKVALVRNVEKTRIRHDMVLRITDADSTFIKVRAYIDQDSRKIECSERDIEFYNPAPSHLNKRAVAKLSLTLDQMNRILQKYHWKKVFDFCYSITTEKRITDCYEGSHLGQVNIVFKDAPQVGYDAEKQKFYLVLKEVETREVGLASILPPLRNTKIYFTFGTCREKDGSHVCLSIESQNESMRGLATNWLSAIKKSIEIHELNFIQKTCLPRKLALPGNNLHNDSSLEIEQVTSEMQGISIYFSKKKKAKSGDSGCS